MVSKVLVDVDVGERWNLARDVRRVGVFYIYKVPFILDLSVER